MQMKNQGMPEKEIISNLQQQGISPKEINNALSQVQIKRAVSDEEKMEKSIVESTPSPEEYPGEESLQEYESYSPQKQGYQEYQQQNPSQENLQQQEYGAPQGIDANNVMEISEQVFSEKIQKIQKKIEEINEFKVIYKERVDDISERIKKIESIIDRLQISVLEKVGSYGQGIESIKKEMSMMQDSFGKMVNPILDASKKETFRKTQEYNSEEELPEEIAEEKIYEKQGQKKKSAKR